MRLPALVEGESLESLPPPTSHPIVLFFSAEAAPARVVGSSAGIWMPLRLRKIDPERF